MSNLKDLASKAKNRLLSRGLRDTYSGAAVINSNMMNFNQKQNYDSRENQMNNESPVKFLLRDNLMMNMSTTQKERYILDTIRRYQEQKNKIDNKFGS